MVSRPVVRTVLSLALVGGAVPLVNSAQGAPGLIAEDVRHVATVPGATGGHSIIDGDRLYVGAYGAGMRLFDIQDPYAPVELGKFVPGPQPGEPDNDVGARADAVPDAAVLDGRHIVTLNGTGRTAGTQQTEFLDWTDPADPKLLFRFTNAEDGESHNGDIVDSRGWWIPSGRIDFRIYDLRPLLQATPKAPQRLVAVNPRTLWEQSPYRGDRPLGGPSTSIHDIEIYADREVLLPRDQWTDSNGDGVADPTRAKRDIALVAEGGNYLSGNNTGSLYILDITDPSNPVALLRHQRKAADGAPQRYVHEAQFLQGQSDIIVTTDEDLHSGCGNGGIATFRVSEDLTEIKELAQWFIGVGTPAPVCSVHVMSTKDDYAFFGSYNAGLQVVDLSDPAKPVRAGRHIAPGANSWGALVHPAVPGYLTYVGDFGGRGLDVFEFMPDTAAQGVVVGNPGTTRVSGVNETLCEQSGEPTGPTVDALLVDVPAEAATGKGTLRAVGEGDAPRDLRVYFYDKDCAFMGGASLNADDADAVGPVPPGARYAAVTNALPGATKVFVQLG
ncbi:MAG TPA: hypothetical protein VM433_14500 [Mycobacteriales bacterium]|nr:hypothetical protein [Mycobacteriales bacterium]